MFVCPAFRNPDKPALSAVVINLLKKHQTKCLAPLPLYTLFCSPILYI